MLDACKDSGRIQFVVAVNPHSMRPRANHTRNETALFTQPFPSRIQHLSIRHIRRTKLRVGSAQMYFTKLGSPLRRSLRHRTTLSIKRSGASSMRPTICATHQTCETLTAIQHGETICKHAKVCGIRYKGSQTKEMTVFIAAV